MVASVNQYPNIEKTDLTNQFGFDLVDWSVADALSSGIVVLHSVQFSQLTQLGLFPVLS